MVTKVINPCLTIHINFVTWTRSINGVKKESTLDHIYTDNGTLINEVTFKVPTFGDHCLVIAKLYTKAERTLVSVCKRNWRIIMPFMHNTT